MANEIEEQFNSIIDTLEQCYNDIDKLEDVSSEINVLKDYVVRRLKNYEDNYKRVEDSEFYDIDDYDFI